MDNATTGESPHFILSWNFADSNHRIYDANGSMGPDKGLTCTVYEQKDCNDKGWNTAPGWKYPGTPNYHSSQFLEDHGMLGNGIISIKCNKG